jgi:hypothetical protein
MEDPMKITRIAISLILALSLASCGGGGDGTGPGTGDGGGGDVLEVDGLDTDTVPGDVIEDSPPPMDLWLVDGGSQDVKEALTILSVEPATGKTTGGEQVLIKGRGFSDGLMMRFGEAWAPEVFVMTSETASLTTPANFPGLVDVIAVLPDEQVAVKADGFLYYNEVAIYEVDPPLGPTTGGMPVVVSGTGFTGDSHLLIGDREAIDVQVLDDSEILAITPPGTTGTANVFVSNSKGVGQLIDGYTFFDYPTIQSVTPAAGPVTGGTQVVISMIGADPAATVLLGGKTPDKVTFLDWGHLEITTPPGQVGPVDLQVTTPYGIAALPGAFHYYSLEDPPVGLQLLGVQPAMGPAHGGVEVVVAAFGLTSKADTTLLFGTSLAEVLEVDPSAAVVKAVTPPGTVGPVDVTLMNSQGQDLLPGGYIYQDSLDVLAVTPNHGPTGGGTAAIITGAGFGPGAQVMIGALPAMSVTYIDAQTLQVLTPPGSPGAVDVTVTSSGKSGVLHGGFVYEGPTALYVVDPTAGAVAGGTYIKLIGSGFVGDVDVFVGGSPCSHIVIHSETLVTAKTPPGPPGTVDVTVTTDQGEATLPLAFTYFDPLSFYGGTWGGPVDGTVNVTVLDSGNGQPLGDVFVMLWTSPDTPFQGYTNLNGQVTFSGPDLLGDQMVTGSKECYANASVVEYNATNVTLYMSYNCPSSGSPPPGVAPPQITGRVHGFDKYVVVPPGPCEYDGPEPYLCDACATDDDCGDPYNVCLKLGDEGNHCLTPCNNDEDCPIGFGCKDVSADIEFGHCVPLGGTKQAVCYTSKGHFLAETPDNGPGAVVDMETGEYHLVSPFGEVAVVCVGGIMPLCQPEDTYPCVFSDSTCINHQCWKSDGRPEMIPYAIGVARHVMAASPGQLIADVNIWLSTPMNRQVDLGFDNAPLDWDGPDILMSRAYIDFGSDGVFEFFEFPYKFVFEEPVLTFEHLPNTLTGDFEGSEYAFLGMAITNGSGVGPHSFTLLSGIDELDDDSMYYLEAGTWSEADTGVVTPINGLWGAAWDDLYGVGKGGKIVHFNGGSWAPQPSPTVQHLNGIWGTATDHILAVGDGGTLLKFAGAGWVEQDMPTNADLTGIWGAGPTFVVAVGEYTIQGWNGTSWAQMPGSVFHDLRAVWGSSPTDIWAVGRYGRLLHFDGLSWTLQPSPVGTLLLTVWGTSPTDVWVAGEAGTLLHYDGSLWSVVEIGTAETLRDIWGTGPDDVYMVGTHGQIFHWDGESWTGVTQTTTQGFGAVWGDGEGHVVVTGDHQIVLGPMLNPPAIVYPTDGGAMEELFLEWTVEPGPPASFTTLSVAQPGMMGPVPYWDLTTDGDVLKVDLPDLPNIEGTPGLPGGFYQFTIMRIYKDMFSIDNFDALDQDYRQWRSWATFTSTFTVQ